MTKHVQVRLEEPEYEEFRNYFKKSGLTSVQDAGRQALLDAIRGVADKEGRVIPAGLRAYANKLADILASGDNAAVKSVTGLIDFLHGRAAPASKR